MFPLYRERKHCFTEYLHLPLYPNLPGIHCSPVSHPHSLQEYTKTNVMTIKNANHLKDRNDICNCYIQITMDETHVKADLFPSFIYNHCPSQYTRKSSYQHWMTNEVLILRNEVCTLNLYLQTLEKVESSKNECICSLHWSQWIFEVPGSCESHTQQTVQCILGLNLSCLILRAEYGNISIIERQESFSSGSEPFLHEVSCYISIFFH